MSKKKRFLTLFLLVIGTIFVFWSAEDVVLTSSHSIIPVTGMRRFKIVDDNNSSEEITCQFPSFDPWHPDAMKYYEKYPTTKCKGMTTLTYYDGEAVLVNQTLKNQMHGKREIQCWYRDVNYLRRLDFANGDWHGPFTHFMLAKGQPKYIEAMCTTKNGKTVSRMHHYIIREEYRRRAKPSLNITFKANQLNVILVGVDSMSSFLFKRAMPKTRQYLTGKLKAIEMNKYNKVGDNTFPNLLALTAGIYEREPRNWSIIEGFDALTFIWKYYKAAGYRTQYTSDRFDFNDFQRPPTDSYSLPMVSALMKDKVNFDNDCYEDKIEVKLWLNYVIEFAKESLFTTGRFFSLAMFKRPTHDFPNKASAVDEHYESFLKELYENNLLNNTFLVFFGDHGQKASSYRRTYLGSIEERAANMVIYVPPWFKDKYPMHYKNLWINKDRLTTNFDIHETLKSLLSLSDKSYQREFSERPTRGLSLFTEISTKRTCEDAELDPHNCLCHGGVSVINTGIMNEVGKHVVNDINSLLLPVKSLCAPLTLNKVISLVVLKGYVGWSATYRIMLSTSPGDAEFEATVKYTVKAIVFKSIQTLSYISRINMYRGQSDCVDYSTTFKMYCYCRNILKSQMNAST